MGIVTLCLCPEEIQSTLSNVCHPVLAEIIKVISHLEKNGNSIDSE